MRVYLILGAALALTISPAMAGGKGGAGGHTTTQNHPQESVSLNYGKVGYTYKQQKPDGTVQAVGKRIHKPITVTKKTDVATQK
jgi:type VI protein secretion system component Hcp